MALVVGAVGGALVWFGTASVASAATSGYIPPAGSGTAITGSFPDFMGNMPAGAASNSAFDNANYDNGAFMPGVCYADYYQSVDPTGQVGAETVTFGCQGFEPAGASMSNAAVGVYDPIGVMPVSSSPGMMQLIGQSGPAYYPASCSSGSLDPLGAGGGIIGDITTCGPADSWNGTTAVQAPYTVGNQSGIIDAECFVISTYTGPAMSGAQAIQFRGYCGYLVPSGQNVPEPLPSEYCGGSNIGLSVDVWLGSGRYSMPILQTTCLGQSNYETVPGVPPFYYSGGQASAYGVACQLKYISGTYDQSVAAGQTVDYTIGFSGAASAIAIDPRDESRSVYLPGAPQQSEFEVGADYTQIAVGGEPAQVSVAPVSAQSQFDPTFFCLYQGTWYPWGDAASSPSPPANASPPSPGAFSLSSCLASSGMSLTDPVSWVTGMARDSVCVVQWLVVPSPA